MKTLVLCCLLFSGIVCSQDLKVGLKSEMQSEKFVKAKLLRVLGKYDVQKWTFTDTLIIANDEIPHSHPVLTLNTKPQSELSLLSTYIHENIHWFIRMNNESTKKAIQQLKSKFKEVPVGNGEGAIDEYSTYAHLLVNYLEYDAIAQLVGSEDADTLLSQRTYYKWIYSTVLANKEYFKELI